MQQERPHNRTSDDDRARSRPTHPADPTSGDGRAPGRSVATRLSVLVPAATFVVGLVLGAVGTGIARDVDDVPGSPTPAEPAETPTATSTPRPDGSITIPDACLQMADTAEQVSGLLRAAAEAAGALEAAQLSGIVRQMGETEAVLQAQSQECRAGTGPASPAQ